jgi:hypothetical protein
MWLEMELAKKVTPKRFRENTLAQRSESPPSKNTYDKIIA